MVIRLDMFLKHMNIFFNLSAKNRGTCDDDVCACFQHLIHSFLVDAAVHLDQNIGISGGIQHSAQFLQLSGSFRNVFLSAEARIDAHDQNHVHFIQHRFQYAHRRQRIQSHARLHSLRVDHVQGKRKIGTRLRVNRQHIRSAFLKALDIALRILDHQGAHSSGADIILIPELPYNIENVCAAIQKRSEQGKTFSILAVAEGVYDVGEAAMKKKERAAARAAAGERTATNRIARQIEEATGFETRVCVPGHMQRGGSPSAYDRVLATEFGTYAAKLVEADHYGVAVAMKNNIVTENALKDIAGKTKLVPETCDMLTVARRMGVSLG